MWKVDFHTNFVIEKYFTPPSMNLCTACLKGQISKSLSALESLHNEIICHFSSLFVIIIFLRCFLGQQRRFREIFLEIFLCANVVFLLLLLYAHFFYYSVLMTHHLEILSVARGHKYKSIPILGHGREVPQRWPLFLRFSIKLGPYYIHQLYQSQNKNWVDSFRFSSRNTWT